MWEEELILFGGHSILRSGGGRGTSGSSPRFLKRVTVQERTQAVNSGGSYVRVCIHVRAYVRAHTIYLLCQ